MWSRLGRDKYGRPVVVVTTPSPGQPVGMSFLVIGNAVRAAEHAVYFLEHDAAERRGTALRRRESLAAAPVDARKEAIREDGPTATVGAVLGQLEA